MPSNTIDKKRLLILDSNALLHRAFHALPPLTTKKGEPTGAVYGFLLTLFKAIKDLKPAYIVACFDLALPTFRHQKFAEYKAKRPKTPEELKTQLPKIKEVLEVLKIPIFEKEGFEADDLIATISTKAAKNNKELEIYILSGDLDALQLINKNIKVYTLGRGIKDAVIYDKEKVLSRFGIGPEQIVDFKALVGDPSDNISGVLGIGKKTASELLKKYTTIDNLYQKIKEGKTDIKPRIKDTLLKNKKQAFFSRMLVEVKKDIELDFDLEKYQFGRFNPNEVGKALSNLEFNSLINRLASFQKT